MIWPLAAQSGGEIVVDLPPLGLIRARGRKPGFAGCHRRGNPRIDGGKPKYRAPTVMRSTSRTDALRSRERAALPSTSSFVPRGPGEEVTSHPADDAEIGGLGHQVVHPAEALSLDVERVEILVDAAAHVDGHAAREVDLALLVRRQEGAEPARVREGRRHDEEREVLESRCGAGAFEKGRRAVETQCARPDRAAAPPRRSWAR